MTTKALRVEEYAKALFANAGRLSESESIGAYLLLALSAIAEELATTNQQLQYVIGQMAGGERGFVRVLDES
jgi:hypothetical protein